MRKHTAIYLKAFGYDPDLQGLFVPSEISEIKGVDINHIVTREDRIENLMMLTRDEHTDYGEKKQYMRYLLLIHRRQLQINNIKFDENWFTEKLKLYPESK